LFADISSTTRCPVPSLFARAERLNAIRDQAAQLIVRPHPAKLIFVG
jgi:hypothetical protein